MLLSEKENFPKITITNSQVKVKCTKNLIFNTKMPTTGAFKAIVNSVTLASAADCVNYRSFVYFKFTILVRKCLSFLFLYFLLNSVLLNIARAQKFKKSVYWVFNILYIHSVHFYRLNKSYVFLKEYIFLCCSFEFLRHIEDYISKFKGHY